MGAYHCACSCSDGPGASESCARLNATCDFAFRTLPAVSPDSPWRCACRRGDKERRVFQRTGARGCGGGGETGVRRMRLRCGRESIVDSIPRSLHTRPVHQLRPGLVLKCREAHLTGRGPGT